MMMLSMLVLLAFSQVGAVQGAKSRLDAGALEIYFIDVEGGQSTLIVTPAGQSLLVDSGFPGAGTFQSSPGDPQHARDAQRILAAAHQAGLKAIDYLLITHFHADHDGGVPELARLIPIRTFIDHGSVAADEERAVPGTMAAFNAYAAVRAKRRHMQPKPGDRLPLTGLNVVIVSAAASTLVTPLEGGGAPNPACGAPVPQPPAGENSRSTGFRLQFGSFRFVDLGDLSGSPLTALFCPNDRLGPVDVYLLPHHGNDDVADVSTFGSAPPRVAVLNNGATKGGGAEMFAALRRAPRIEDVWQLHRSTNEGAQNFVNDRIANLDESTAHWLKVSAREDGSFVVTNGRTGSSTRYPAIARSSGRSVP